MDNRPKIKLIAAVICIFCSLCLIAGSICLICFSDLKDYENKTFTFKSLKEISGYKGRAEIEINVAETDSPMNISYLSYKYINKQALRELTGGEIIECIVIKGNGKYSYELAEISYKGTKVLSFSDTEKAYKNNALAGAIGTAAVALIMISVSVTVIYKLKHCGKKTNKTPDKENSPQ